MLSLDFFFILGINSHLFEEKYRKSISDFLHLVNNDLREINKTNKYIVNIWIQLIENIIPPDFYKYCNDKLFITIHTIGFLSIKQQNISKYESNEHLINTIKCSGTIPYVTVPTCFTLYNNNHYALDGLFPSIVDDTYKTLYVNSIRYEYPLLHRIYLKEKFYEPIMIESLLDIYHFYKFGESKKSLYYYEKKKGTNSLTTHLSIVFRGVFLQLSIGYIINHFWKRF